jgi:hypothetical protein
LESEELSVNHEKSRKIGNSHLVPSNSGHGLQEDGDHSGRSISDELNPSHDDDEKKMTMVVDLHLDAPQPKIT